MNGGESLYYTYRQRGVIIFSTISYAGDVDIYVSTTSQPGWENYEYSSISTSIDTVLVPHDGHGEVTLYLGLHGHAFHNKSTCLLLIISPSREDILTHQVWELDPATDQEMLVIDIDPLWMKNDPKLHESIEIFAGGSTLDIHRGVKFAWEWFLWIIAGILKIAVEVFL